MISDNYDVTSDWSDSDMEVEENSFEHEIEKELEVTPEITLNPKVARAIQNLQASCNEDASKIIEQAE